jgi:putative membrane protein insertion efficiency factor
MMQKSPNKYLPLILVISLSTTCFAQKDVFKSDIEQIHLELSKQQHKPVESAYIYHNESSVIRKLNPIGLLFGGTLYVYQNVLSKHISADCLFTPSCSEFSKEAIKDTGLLRGTILTINRVNRCNRIAAQDLKNYSIDPKTSRYPDPVSRYSKASNQNAE